MRSFEVRETSAGFTLIEVLVALSVVAVLLASIGALVAANVRGVRSVDQRLSLLQTTRTILTGFPDRAQFVPGDIRGNTSEYRWRIDVQPFVANFVDPRRATPWVPQAVILRVEAPSGQVIRIDTVRLRRAEGARR